MITIFATLCLALSIHPQETSVRINRVATGSMVAVVNDEVYVLTAGHAVRKGQTCRVEVYYANDKRIHPRGYVGEVLCSKRDILTDVALIKFSTKLKMATLPIASTKPQLYDKCVRTSNGEAVDTILFDGLEKLTTVKNVALHGDSGGGLFVNNELIGITKSSDLSYKTYYTSYLKIREFLEKEGYLWITNSEN